MVKDLDDPKYNLAVKFVAVPLACSLLVTEVSSNAKSFNY